MQARVPACLLRHEQNHRDQLLQNSSRTAICSRDAWGGSLACPRCCRWFSGAAAGSITATSCLQGTFGDSVISVLSSPNPVGGPYTCVG